MQRLKIQTLAAIVTLGFLLSACDAAFERAQPASGLIALQEQQVGDIKVVLLDHDGQLQQGTNTLVLEFHEGMDNTLADISRVEATAFMPERPDMTGEVTTVTPAHPGTFAVTAALPLPGRWNLDVLFNEDQRVRFALDVTP